jgi:ECF sigma factor
MFYYGHLYFKRLPSGVSRRSFAFDLDALCQPGVRYGVPIATEKKTTIFTVTDVQYAAGAGAAQPFLDLEAVLPVRVDVLVRLELLDQVGSLAEDSDLVLSLDELLTRLGEGDAAAAQVAQLHLFGGLSVEEAGAALGLSRAVAYRNWKYARAWLREALGK